jgi:hypothetical protein
VLNNWSAWGKCERNCYRASSRSIQKQANSAGTCPAYNSPQRSKTEACYGCVDGKIVVTPEFLAHQRFKSNITAAVMLVLGCLFMFGLFIYYFKNRRELIKDVIKHVVNNNSNNGNQNGGGGNVGGGAGGNLSTQASSSSTDAPNVRDSGWGSSKLRALVFVPVSVSTFVYFYVCVCVCVCLRRLTLPTYASAAGDRVS